MKKIIIIAVLVGFIAFPTITLGGTFVSSLIKGKTVKEAVQVLAEQIDSLVGRVADLENKVSKDELCQNAQKLYVLLPPVQNDPITGETIGRIMAQNIVDLYNDSVEYNQRAEQANNPMQFGEPINLEINLNIIKEYYDKYILAKFNCDGQVPTPPLTPQVVTPHPIPTQLFAPNLKDITRDSIETPK